MSINLRDTSAADDTCPVTYGPHFLASEGDWVGFTARRRRKDDGAVTVQADMDRNDFLNAVADECNVIVIPREDLPEARVNNGCYYAGGVVVSGAITIERADESILGWLAIHERLAAQSHVDEVQVKALSDLLMSNAGTAGWENFARQLYERGVRVEVPE